MLHSRPRRGQSTTNKSVQYSLAQSYSCFGVRAQTLVLWDGFHKTSVPQDAVHPTEPFPVPIQPHFSNTSRYTMLLRCFFADTAMRVQRSLQRADRRQQMTLDVLHYLSCTSVFCPSINHFVLFASTLPLIVLEPCFPFHKRI